MAVLLVYADFFLQRGRELLLTTHGAVYKGFPTQKWGNHKSAIAYMGLGAYLGYLVSQNGKG